MAFCAKDLKGLSAGQKLDIYLIIIDRPKIAIEKTILVLVFYHSFKTKRSRSLLFVFLRVLSADFSNNRTELSYPALSKKFFDNNDSINIFICISFVSQLFFSVFFFLSLQSYTLELGGT